MELTVPMIIIAANNQTCTGAALAGGGSFQAGFVVIQQQSSRAHVKSPTLAVAVKMLLEVKTQSNRRACYIKGLRQYLNAFIRGREDTSLDGITADDLEMWFAGRAEKPNVRSSNLGRLGSLFSFAVRRDWITDSPVKRMERHTVEPSPPQILTPEQARFVMEWTLATKSRWLAYATLCLFAGVRPEEALNAKWSNVNLEHGTVTVDASASKVRRRRVIHLQPAAIAWMKAAKQAGADLDGLTRIGRRRFLKRLRKAMGFQRWPQDIMRHSCASYWIAQVQDAGKVALALGNSAGILLRHYRELVNRDVADAFWNIMPAIET